MNKHTVKQLIEDTANNRVIFIERNEKFEVVGLNFLQGNLDDIIKDKSINRLRKNDEKLLEAYNEVISGSKLNGTFELKTINEVCWMMIDE